MKQILSCIEKITGKDLDRDQVRLLNPLVLAFIGDTVYDLFIRTYLIYNHDLPVHQLHVKASGFVRAGSQSRTLHDIESFLTEDELNIVRRGRNAKSGTIPKNADVTEYRWATGLESLLGYLFLLGQEERICQLFDLILKK